MSDVLDHALSAERLNAIVKQGWDYFREVLRSGIRNIWQDGILVGETKPASHLEELMALEPREAELFQTALDPAQEEGIRVRAQQGLQRLAELRQEVFGG